MKMSELVVKVKEVQEQLQRLVKKLDADAWTMERKNQNATCSVEEQFPQYNAYNDVVTIADLGQEFLNGFLKEVDNNANTLSDLEF